MDPGGPPVLVGMQPARIAAARVGLLVYGGGGPGRAQRAALTQILPTIPASVQDRFDVAAVEPPGVGPDGAPGVLTCAAAELEAWLGADLQAVDPRARTAVHAAASRLVERCVKPQLDLARRMSTGNAVAGVEALRRRVGGSVTYVGTSYDSLTGYVYTRQHPGALRALVLDSGLDPALTGPQLLRDRAAAVEAALGRFTADCTATRCLGRLGVSDAIARLRKAAATPSALVTPATPAPTGRRAVGLSRRQLDEALLGGLVDERNGWADLRNGLRTALAGDGNLLRQVADSYQARGPEGVPTSQAVQAAAYLCRDRAWPRTPAELDRLADDVAATAPILGRAVVYGSALCTTWPVPPRPLPAMPGGGQAPKGSGRSGPAVLVLSVDRDPVTPPAWSRRLAAAFTPPAPVVTIPGAWHTALPNARNPCAITTTETFLTDPVASIRDGTCPKA